MNSEQQIEMSMSKLKVFEVEAAGFLGDGSSDELIVWVAATGIDEASQAVHGSGATVIEIVGQSVSELGDAIDYVLPQDSAALRHHLEVLKAA